MFTFNGINFSSSGLNIKGRPVINRPFMAPQKISTAVIEGRAEETYNRKTSATYNIDIELYLFSGDKFQLNTDLRTLAGLLNTSKPEKLIFHDEPNKYVKAIVENTEVEKVGKYAIVGISFKVIDPYWYFITAEGQELTLDGSFWTTNGVKAINRIGNVESYPLIEITTNRNFSGEVKFGANGSSMTYTGPIEIGEKLIIDSTLLTAYILSSDGISKRSVISKLDVLDFPVLAAGDNNFTIEMPNEIAGQWTCKVYNNSRWI